MKRFINENRQTLFCTITVFLCFFLTSTGYLAWLYRVLEICKGSSELLTMGLGYVLQAAGMGAFALAAFKKPAFTEKRAFAAALAAYLAFTALSAAAKGAWAAVAFGLAGNAVCGVIAGFYLYHLQSAPVNRRGIAFGAGYALAALASWALSLCGKKAVYGPMTLTCVCAAVTAALLFAVYRAPTPAETQEQPLREDAPFKKLLLPACAIVFLFSAVNRMGFSFPSADILNGVDPEFSRLFYAAGLLLAGFVSDKSRKHGAVLTLGALIVPFILPLLQKEAAPAAALWAISYFASGFFSVYRVLLFTDLTQRQARRFLSGFGLLFGRLGEALGTLLFTAAGGNTLAAILTAAALYAVTLALFFLLYQKLYLPRADREKEERLRFQRFALQHDLSPREKEILQKLLEKETTPAIAQALFVSESTVKFHVHNLLQKTGCKNRKELTELYGRTRG